MTNKYGERRVGPSGTTYEWRGNRRGWVRLNLGVSPTAFIDEVPPVFPPGEQSGRLQRSRPVVVTPTYIARSGETMSDKQDAAMGFRKQR